MLILLNILGRITATIPECVAEMIARALGSFVYLSMRSRRQMMLRNLHHCFPNKSEKQRRAIALESCRRTIELGMFVLASPHFSKERIAENFKFSEEDFKEHLPLDSPAIGAIPHFTLMESLTLLPSVCHELQKRQIGIFYRPFDNPALERWVKSTRERFGCKLLSRKKGLTQALEFLGENGLVCVLFDQNAGRTRGALSLFFGRIATCSPLAGMLFKGCKSANIAVAYCERTSFWHGTLRMETVETKSRDTDECTIEINKVLENRLSKSDDACADWLWLHNRWKGFDNLHFEHKRNIIPQTLAAYGISEIPRNKRIWIRLPNWLGDIVMALPLVKTIRSARPDAEITLLAQAHFLPMLKMLNAADRLIALPPKGKGYWKFFRALRLEYPDQWYAFTNSLRGDVEGWLARVPMRAGMVRPGKPRPLLTKKWNVPADLDLTTIHQTHVWERWLRERHELKIPLDFSPIKIVPAEKNAMRIGMICGTENSPEKRWPVERWLELISILQTKIPTLEIFLFGTKKDAEITAKVAAGQNNKIVDRAGKTDLPSYMTELASCRAICANDTGGMHLANMLGVPVIGIFGPTNPVRTGPVFDSPKEILQPDGCAPTGGMDISLVPAARAAEAVARFCN